MTKMGSQCYLLIILSVFLFLSACAKVTITPVDPEDDTGIRYYEPHPYLLVSTQVAKNGEVLEGTKRFEIVYLPDTSKQRTINISSGFGSAEMNPTLENGWMLIGMSGKADSKVSENLKALASFADFIPKMLPSPDDGIQDGFYRLLFNQKGELEEFGPRIEIKGRIK